VFIFFFSNFHGIFFGIFGMLSSFLGGSNFNFSKIRHFDPLLRQGVFRILEKSAKISKNKTRLIQWGDYYV
jgi:hypothetical protein